VKRIEAIITPFKLDEVFKLDDVKDALTVAGIIGMTVTEVTARRRRAHPHGAARRACDVMTTTWGAPTWPPTLPKRSARPGTARARLERVLGERVRRAHS
jgi:hypothetical protein